MPQQSSVYEHQMHKSETIQQSIQPAFHMQIWANVMQLPTRTALCIIIAVFAICTAGISVIVSSPSADLYALYLASWSYGAGDSAAVYTDPTPMFQLSVPEAWDDLATRLGITERPLFPYIYPPLWAALFSPVTSVLPPTVFAFLAFIVNPILLGLCAVLAHRIMRPSMDMVPWTALCIAFVATTSFGWVALGQNQPQIFVSFLIILAIEKDRANSPLLAGAALALAASIKLYPALFAIIWLGAGNWRALLSFTGFGALLGGTSVLLTGWPLHAEFLGQIEIIANSLISCQICLNLDSTLTQWIMADFLRDVIGIRDKSSGEVVNVVVSQKPALFQSLDRVLLLFVMFALLVFSRQSTRDAQFTMLWPAAILAVAFFSPLTWTYHYLSVIFFLPALLVGKGRVGWLTLGAFWLLYSIGTLWLLDRVPSPFYLAQLLGTLGIVAMFCLFVTRKQDAASLST